MKEFCKWLGVDEKIARVVVWIAIFMGMLIIVNAALESVGLPFYRITTENLSHINYGIVVERICQSVITLLNFYAVIFLVFRIKDFKKIFPYSILYLILNYLSGEFGYIYTQVFILIYLILFCYFYSGRKVKYSFYIVGSIIVDVIVQYICYLYKIRFINFSSTTAFDQLLMSIDYFIIMFAIILIKEIYIKNKKKGVSISDN